MNLIMMNGWEATHAMADHGVIDSELLSSTAACQRGVLFGFQPYCRHSASLNHLCLSSGRTENMRRRIFCEVHAVVVTRNEFDGV